MALQDINCDIPENIVVNIRQIGERLSIDRMIVFGSRARGDNGTRSDIDLAIRAKDSKEFFDLKDSLEGIDTLLSFDLVDLNSDSISKALIDEIERDGVVIYEKI